MKINLIQSALIVLFGGSFMFGQNITPGSSGGGGGGGVTSISSGCGLTGGPITVSGTIAQIITSAAHSGSYAIVAGDCGKVLTFAAAATPTLPQAGTGGFTAGWFVIVENTAASGNVVVTTTTSTFYGSGSSGSTSTLAPGTSTRIVSDGTNYLVESYRAGLPPASTAVLGTTSSSQTTAATAHGLSLPPACAAASASGSAYTCTTSPTFVPAAGDTIYFKADLANTGTASLVVNSQVGTPNIHKVGGSVNLTANDLLANQYTILLFDGTNWDMQGQIGNAPTTGTVTSIATSCGLSGGTITSTGTLVETVVTAAHNGSYALLTGDCGKILTTNTAAAWTIAQAGTTGFEAGKFWTANNVGSGSLTITATTSTFYGGPTANISSSVLTVPPNTSVTIFSDGTNYQAVSGGGGSSSVNVNGSPVTNPNFNGTTPAAGAGNTNVIFQVSGSSVSGYLANWVAGAGALTGPGTAQTLPASLTSGGVVCNTSTSQMASSVLLAANSIVIGGGAGACPTATTAIPTGTTATSGGSGNQVATNTDVANAIAGVNPAVAVQYATTAAGDTSGLTYANGASGVGATMTGVNNTVTTIDGHAFVMGDVGISRLLIKNDTQSPSGAFNGIYLFTALHTGITGDIFTRALDYDQPSDMNNTGAIPVVSGTANASTSWLMTANVVTVGTTPLTFVQFSYNPANIPTQASNGTSGGVPCYTGANKALISSSLLTANAPVIGGGSGVCPAALSATIPALTDGATVTWAIASAWTQTASLLFTTHGGNRTLNITGPLAGSYYTLKMTQDATGGEGLILGTGCTWQVLNGGVPATTVGLSSAANGVNVIAFYYDGTNCVANFH